MSAPTALLPRRAFPGSAGAATDAAAGRVPTELRVPLAVVVLGVALLPLLVPTGPGNTSPVDLVLWAAVVVAVPWSVSARLRVRAPYAVSMGLFVTAGLAAALFGAFPVAGAVAVAQDLYLLAWCWTLANVVRTPRAMSLVLGAWMRVALVWSAGLVAAAETGSSLADYSQGSSRAAFTYGEQNGAALYLVVSLAVMLAAGRPRRMSMRLLAVGLVGTAVVMTGSLAGLLGMGLLFGVTAVLAAWNRAGPALAAALTVAVILAGAVGIGLGALRVGQDVSGSSLVLVRDSLARAPQSAAERDVLAQEELSLYGTSGLLGLGPNSTLGSLQAKQAPYVKSAHDDFAAALLERGLLGLLGAVLLVTSVVVRVMSVRERGRLLHAYRDVVPHPEFLAGAMAAVLVFTVTHESFHDRTVWTLFALIAALYLWARQEPGRRERIAR